MFRNFVGTRSVKKSDRLWSERGSFSSRSLEDAVVECAVVDLGRVHRVCRNEIFAFFLPRELFLRLWSEVKRPDIRIFVLKDAEHLPPVEQSKALLQVFFTDVTPELRESLSQFVMREGSAFLDELEDGRTHEADEFSTLNSSHPMFLDRQSRDDTNNHEQDPIWGKRHFAYLHVGMVKGTVQSDGNFVNRVFVDTMTH